MHVNSTFEVFELRTGYWEVTWQSPERAEASTGYDCYTPEELESLRFFAPDNECTVSWGGKQTKTTYEIDMVCATPEASFPMHFS